MIDRRTVVICLAAASLRPAHAATEGRPKLAALFTQWSTGNPSHFRAAIAEHGWVNGHNIQILERFAEGHFDRLVPLAAELVALNPDVIFTHTSVAARAVVKATQTIPVVVGPASEEDLIELAGDLARPRTNVTGLTFVSREMHEKCIELLVQASPLAKRIAVLIDPRLSAYRDYPGSMAPGLAPLGLTLLRIEVPGGPPGIDAAFLSLAQARADGVLVLTMPGFNEPGIARAIVERATAIRLPVVAAGDFYARAGGILSFGPDYTALVRRGAAYVDKILRGAKPVDLPVERPTVFKLVVNKAAATSLGLTISTSILLRADEVIE